MTKKNKHIDVDLDFLDAENTSKKSVSSHNPKITNKKGSVKKYNWKTILIFVGITIVIIWIGVSEDSSSPTSTYTSPSTSQIKNISVDDESIEYGEYRCSQYHYDKAVALSPSESEQALENAQLSMETRANEIERLQREIESSYGNEYSSQWEIDDYNDTVETYNAKLTSYQRDATALDSRIDKFNMQVEAHNNYLVQNCSLR
jgi:peptidoglycan hydrolase CwlO-like protein